MARLPALFLGILLGIVLAAPLVAQEPPVARGKGGASLTRSELETVLLERHAYSENGRELLELYLRSRLLESMAAARGLKVKDSEVDRKLAELERATKAVGQTLSDEIRRRNLTPAQFRDFLRLALAQQHLARAALKLPPDQALTEDQQEIWLQQEIQTRGQELLPPVRGLEGALLRCGEITVTRAEFATFLRARLSRETVQESAWHLLLARALDQRMPDLAPEARARAIEQELTRRRERHAQEFPQITFEQRLAATGRSLETLRSDPSVAIAALSRVWVDRTAGPEGLRAAYEAERELFEARYGEAIRASLLLRRAGRFVNQLVPRTFDEAERELSEFAAKCNDLATFTELVAKHSEEPGSKKQKGDLGFVTRGETRVPAALREELFRVIDQGGTIPPRGLKLGPVRLDSGVALLWATERRPSPSWEEMSARVHEELRRRLLEELMPQDSVELVDAKE